MRNRKGYTRQTMLFPDGKAIDILESDEFPHLGVADAVEDPGFYYIYHIPSRCLAGVVEGQDNALKLIPLLGAVPGLEQEQIPQVALDTALALLRGWRPEKKTKKKPPPPEPGVKLEPVYQPGVTPSVAVRSADRLLANALGRAMAGQEVTVEEVLEARYKAIALAWREALMAAVNQVLANDDEVPQAPIRLADGTLCSWDGFRESYKRLIIIGNDLQVQAFHILDAADEGVDRAAWRELEGRWVELIQEGWLEWTACVSHFLASPPERQEQVRQKLGYIGTRERGWGALGRKTFLRHPEIAEASKARRLVQYEREARRGG